MKTRETSRGSWIWILAMSNKHAFKTQSLHISTESDTLCNARPHWFDRGHIVEDGFNRIYWINIFHPNAFYSGIQSDSGGQNMVQIWDTQTQRSYFKQNLGKSQWFLKPNKKPIVWLISPCDQGDLEGIQTIDGQGSFKTHVMEKTWPTNFESSGNDPKGRPLESLLNHS